MTPSAATPEVSARPSIAPRLHSFELGLSPDLKAEHSAAASPAVRRMVTVKGSLVACGAAGYGGCGPTSSVPRVFTGIAVILLVLGATGLSVHVAVRQWA